MDKVQFSQRETSLKYIIGAFENEHGWLNSVKVSPQKAALGVNAAAMVQLGEALSTKKQATLLEYFELWYKAFKEYEILSQKQKVITASNVRKAFKNRFSSSNRERPTSESSSNLSSDVSQMSISTQESGSTTFQEDATIPGSSSLLNNIPPFPLDGRIVFLCLCQTVLVMYEAIQELTVRDWSAEEKDLYAKLDHKIKQLVIEPGAKMLDNDAKSVIHQERKFLKFMR